VLDRDTRFAPGVARYVLVRVENLGCAVWPWGLSCPAIRLGYHWWSLDGRQVVSDGRRTLLPSTMRPGESLIVAADVMPPAAAGRYVLEVDLVHEMVRWFDCSARLEVQVADRWQRG
jgi:hypothetical protein